MLALKFELRRIKEDNEAKTVEIMRQQQIIDNYEATTKQMEHKAHEL